MLPPVGQSLLITLAVDFGIQLIFYIHAAIFQTEKLYDISGTLTYVTCTLLSLLLRSESDPIANLNARQIIAAVFTLVWTCRLGFYLFARVLREGKDSRFDQVKTKPLQYSIYWFMQFVWVFLTAFPVYILCGNESSSQQPFGTASDIIGIIIWVLGFGIEAISDFQKDAFKRLHPKDFISSGLWSWSRHPNYFGECLLWFGMFILCAGGFSEDRLWEFVSIISPVFVTCLICFVSGIPILERNADKRYGSREDYQSYKAKVPVFFMVPPVLQKSGQVASNNTGNENANVPSAEEKA